MGLTGYSPAPFQSFNENTQQIQEGRCPAMCLQWNGLLKENAQIENTQIPTSPHLSSYATTQCPAQCDPRCCKSQSFTNPSSNVALQHVSPPQCMESCPRACYPACRSACCNAPRLMAQYQQNMQRIHAYGLPYQQFYQQLPMNRRQTISFPLSSSHYNAKAIIPEDRSKIPYISWKSGYFYPHHRYQGQQMFIENRANILHPKMLYASQPSIQQRFDIPKHISSVQIKSCSIPCSSLCAPHCTRHCCESYD